MSRKLQPRKAPRQRYGRTAIVPRKRSSRSAKVGDMGPFVVAIVGRPNVGKSTLFNRLIGRREALVHDRPGVTRDRRYGDAQLGSLRFKVIDTAGFEDADAETMEGAMRRQTEKAIAEADVALMVIDAQMGVMALDEHFAELVRRSSTPIILVANKTEGKGTEGAVLDAYALGLGEPVAISAEHGQGLDDLYSALVRYAPEPPEEGYPEDEEETEDAEPAEGAVPAAPIRPLQLAIVGRPNTGKSTLINRLIGEDRLLTGPEPGVTRDSIPVDWTYQGRPIRLVDTAGVRKRAKVTDAVEKLSVGETFGAIRMAEVVVLVIDASAALETQELTLARHVAEEGRALVIALNKWDTIKEKRSVLEEVNHRLADSLTQVRGVPVVTISGKTGQRVEDLMKAVFKAHETWNTHVPTAALNRWLAAATQAHPTPLSTHKQRIKLRYMTQPKTRPPTFVIFSTRPGDLPEAYMRYLANGLRDTFGLDGIPIRIHLRKPRNPFEEEK
ncbi:MAG: ribosome biogenesis GTPase Der [Rhodospirillaceae bacterium]